MTKPPPARSPQSDTTINNHTPTTSPEKKKQKKKHNASQNQPMPFPKQLFKAISIAPSPSTKLWKRLHTQFPSFGSSYEPIHLFAEEGRSLHNDASKATTLLAKIRKENPDTVKKSNPTSEQWESLFNQATNTPSPLNPKETTFLLTLLMDLSATNPVPLFDTFQTDKGLLRPTIITSLWQAAQSLCGSNYLRSTGKNLSQTKLVNPYKTALQTKETNNSSQPTQQPKTPAKTLHQTKLNSTPRTSNKNNIQILPRRFRERFDMKIYVDPTQANPIKGFTSRIREWFEMLKTFDPDLAILPWFKSATVKPILSPHDIPGDMKQLRHYFQRLSPKSGIVWTKVHLTTNQDPKDIISGPTTQLGWWYKDNDEGLYLRPLRDAEMTQDLGILAYTSNFTNAPHTMEIINNALQDLGCKFAIGGKLRPIKSIKVTEKIKTHHRSKGGTWQNQYWFALHLISDINHQRPAIRFLYKLFNQRDSPQPGGLKARFIPHEGIITMSSTATSKRFKMLNKHRAVIQSLRMIKIDSITQLDEPIEEINHSLRSYLSSLPHSKTGKPLYHSIDLSTSFMDEGSNMVILTALPEHAEEASSLASVLPALCSQKLHPSTQDWFATDALEYCEGVVFETNSNRFHSQEDKIFDDMLDEDFGQAVTFQFEGLPSDLSNDKPSIETNPWDDGSFVSFRTMMDTKRPSTTPTSTGTDSLSSPSFLTDSIQENQAESLAATTAENEELRKQIQSLLLEKEQWNQEPPSKTNTSPPLSPSTGSYSPTFNPEPSNAATRSKGISEGDD